MVSCRSVKKVTFISLSNSRDRSSVYAQSLASIESNTTEACKFNIEIALNQLRQISGSVDTSSVLIHSFPFYVTQNALERQKGVWFFAHTEFFSRL